MYKKINKRPDTELLDDTIRQYQDWIKNNPKCTLQIYLDELLSLRQDRVIDNQIINGKKKKYAISSSSSNSSRL